MPKTKSPLNHIKAIYNKMPQFEQESLRDYIVRDLLRIEKIITPKRACACPHCYRVNIVKNGTKNGKQRYLCRDCRRSFMDHSGTMLSHTQKTSDVWVRYVECFVNKFPLRKCAAICNISVVTAFVWRHKILDALRETMKDIKLEGLIQADETFLRLSFKGNHKVFPADRPPRQRGGEEETRGISSGQACIPCAIDSKGRSIAQLCARGRISSVQLTHFFKNKVTPNSHLITDSLKAYKKVSRELKLQHFAIPKKRRVYKKKHIQTVNSFHSEFKRLVNNYFLGVSTKYLNNYLAYHQFLYKNKDSYMDQQRRILIIIRDTPNHTQFRTLSKREVTIFSSITK